MLYENTTWGTFLARPNRFIAHVEIDGREEVCHVKNTGRCKELLLPGVQVFLEKSRNPARKTNFSLIGVEKGNRLVNMDSQAPNKVVHEWLKKGNLFPGATKIRPETKYGNSRFDFYIEEGDRKIFMEVKGVTLENQDVVQFPDAPTERGVKHIRELCQAVRDGYEAYVFFVVQMKNVNYFTPNMENHRAFGEALIEAEKCGVNILAYDCHVTEDSLDIRDRVEVRLEAPGGLEDQNRLESMDSLEDQNGLESPESMENQNDPESQEGLDGQEVQARLGRLAALLLAWYDANARILPWRETATPYRVWISEIMLQQTRVEAVKPYFERFMNALPTIQDLAEIEEEALLKLWEGLGYYNRARNLQKTAKIVVKEYGGELPPSYEELLKLPGIGSYTAGAVSSIAYGIPVPAVDGNVLRVISRVMASREDILKPSVKKKMEEDLLAVMPQDRPGAFNQALMEIGAMVCVPNGTAKCEVCPLNQICRAKELGIVMELPKKTPKKSRKIEKKTVLVIRSGDKVALRKRGKKGLLAGLYEFPNVEGHLSEQEALELVKKMSFSPIRIQKLEPSKHIFTHKEWHMVGYVVKIEEAEMTETGGITGTVGIVGTDEIMMTDEIMEPDEVREKPEENDDTVPADCIFVEAKESEEAYPIPTAFQAYTKYMNIRLGNEKY